MKKVFAALFTLCLVTIVVPPVSNGDSEDGNDSGISTHEYSLQDHAN